MGNSIRSRASGGEAAADRDFAALRRDTRSQPAKQQKASTRKSPTPSTAPNSAVFSSASVKDWRCGGSGEGGGEGGGDGKDGSKLGNGKGCGGGGGGGGGKGRGDGGCKGGD
jgi:hypothetical protein